MPHLSLRSPLPLHWAGFKKRVKKKKKEKKMAMEIALHHPPPLPFPSNTSCCRRCFSCTLPDAAQGGWWRCKNPHPHPQPHPPSLSPWWNAVDSTDRPLVSSYMDDPPPQPQPFTYSRGEQRRRSKTSSYLNKKRCANLHFSRAAPSIGARSIFFFLVVCTGNDGFPQRN